MKDYNFRYKNKSWTKYECRYVCDAAVYVQCFDDDPYMKAFLSNHILRPSCHNCKFKSDNYNSDITLGDFWGINKCLPAYNDDKGVSEVIVRTEKGEAFLESLSNLEMIKVSKENAYQVCLYKAMNIPTGRDLWFENFKDKTLSETNQAVIHKKSLIGKLIESKNTFLARSRARKNKAFLQNNSNAINKIPFEIKMLCSGCTACMNICRHDAITMQTDSEGFKYPVVNTEKCISCNLCKKICPISNDRIESKPLLFFAAKNLDEEERLKSSSGGAFSVISRKIIEDKGVVYGAAFDEDLNLNHIRIADEDSITLLRCSKYLQSDLNYTFRNVLSDLSEGKKVLFSGTPCQVAGLQSFLRKPFDNLITVDLICHGVPSPMVFRRYIEELDKEKMSF